MTVDGLEAPASQERADTLDQKVTNGSIDQKVFFRTDGRTGPAGRAGSVCLSERGLDFINQPRTSAAYSRGLSDAVGVGLVPAGRGIRTTISDE